MIQIDSFISGFSEVFSKQQKLTPWEITMNLPQIILEIISGIDHEFELNDGIAIHKTARIEKSAVLKAPIIISENCFVAATSYLRGGIYLGNSSIVGPGCEVKTSIIFHDSVVAHLNFIGDSIIGSNVNFEAGSLIANHYNEKVWKEISVVHESQLIKTNCTRFGSLIGDHCRIGANAVLSPGTLLKTNGIVERLSLLDQLSNFNKKLI
jgi:NDP-sugar pyrophosphorylase family protein